MEGLTISKRFDGVNFCSIDFSDTDFPTKYPNGHGIGSMGLKRGKIHCEVSLCGQFYLVRAHHVVNGFDYAGHFWQIDPTVSINVVHTVEKGKRKMPKNISQFDANYALSKLLFNLKISY